MGKAKIFITCGLGYGDEGKGSIVDFLVRKYDADVVIRYNGGPQAAHYVVTPNGTEHCFSQFGSGTLVPGVLTHLSRYMLLKPQNLLIEEKELRKKGISDAFHRLSIDPECAIVTPYHAMIGQMLELSRGKDRFGSVGMGVGQAAVDREKFPEKVLKVKDTFDGKSLKNKLLEHRRDKIKLAKDILKHKWSYEMEKIYEHFQSCSIIDELIDAYSTFSRNREIRFISDDAQIAHFIQQEKTIIFEGSQGALIDYNYGFWPYVTKTDTTIRNAENLISSLKNLTDVKRIGVFRAYNYRHGPGPFISEDKNLRSEIPEIHNRLTDWQGDIRVGWFDLLSIRYGIAINPSLDSLALTHIDKLSTIENVKVCISYEFCGNKRELLDKYFRWERFKGDSIRITGIKPLSNNKSDELTCLLFACRPLEFIEFSGKPKDISSITSFPNLPGRIRNYISYLESREGLSLPISIISAGPTFTHKICK